MTKFLRRRLLTNALLKQFPHFRFEGQIASVAVETVSNPWNLQKTAQPVLYFADGNAWIPNEGAKRLLIDAWGEESEGWIGRWLAIYLVATPRTDRASGRLVEKLEKRVEPLAVTVPPHENWTAR